MATGYTRSTHTVRVKSADKRFFADVEILDAISLTLPNGFQIVYKIAAKNANPYILDETGDGNGKGSSTDCTRSSHMCRMTSQSDSTRFFDYETCDAFTMTGPNDTQHVVKIPGTGGGILSGTGTTDGPTPGGISLTSNVTDNTGSGLQQTAAPATRAQHVVKLTRQSGNGQQVPTDFLLELITDAVAFNGPPDTQGMPYMVAKQAHFSTDYEYGATLVPMEHDDAATWYEKYVWKLPNADTVLNGALTPSAECHDTTVYVIDPTTGEQVPPDNTDPNVYVFFPPDASSPFIGANQAIDMGPIWWIRQIGSVSNTWFWFLEYQHPLAFSFFSAPSILANPKWGYTGGYKLYPWFPVTWILFSNYALVDMGYYGADDIQTAAAGWITSASGGAINPAEGAYPLLDTLGHPTGKNVILAWFGLGLSDFQFGTSTTKTLSGSFVGIGLPIVNYTFESNYMPYGAFNLTAPPQQATEGVFGPAFYPNIWQLTGIDQPPITDSSKAWDPITNPYQQPSLELAQQVVQTYMDNWNSVANAILGKMASYASGDTYPPVPFPIVGPVPPGWAWALPYTGGDIANAQNGFKNGIQPTFISPTPNGTAIGLPLDVYVPATVPTIRVGQLDPTVWNTGPVTDGPGAPGSGLALINPVLSFPPVRWDSGDTQPPVPPT